MIFFTAGGIFHDCLVHDVDVGAWITGEKPEKIHVMGRFACFWYAMDVLLMGASNAGSEVPSLIMSMRRLEYGFWPIFPNWSKYSLIS